MIRRILLITLVSVALAGCGSTPPSPSRSATPGSSSTPSPEPTATADLGDPAAIGRAFIEALARGDTTTAEEMEDDAMRAAAPAATLAEIWGQLVAQFGTFQGLGGVETAEQAPYTNATVGSVFANAIVPLIVTVTADGRVAGLHLGSPVPTGSGSPSASPSPAAYVRPDAFTEIDVTVGRAPWALPGTLSMPNGSGPFPAVVLLAGSGPQDRDETIGPNAPLRDLAGGLASNGIAVLRYDKRTKTYQAEMAADVANVTVHEEVMDDALAAIDLLRHTPGVDPARIFVAGHSLGGFLAPRITAEVPGRMAGIALLEAGSSSLGQLIIAQYEYLASEDGGADPRAAAALDAVRAQVALAESPDLSPLTPALELPLGIPAAYWLDLRTYDPLRTARDLPIPLFFSQGGRDYQVPPSELIAWREALAGRDDVVFREYPALNHLLIAGDGPSRPAEYAVPGHVSPELVADLAAWILGSPS